MRTKLRTVLALFLLSGQLSLAIANIEPCAEAANIASRLMALPHLVPSELNPAKLMARLNEALSTGLAQPLTLAHRETLRDLFAIARGIDDDAVQIVAGPYLIDQLVSVLAQMELDYATQLQLIESVDQIADVLEEVRRFDELGGGPESVEGVVRSAMLADMPADFPFPPEPGNDIYAVMTGSAFTSEDRVDLFANLNRMATAQPGDIPVDGLNKFLSHLALSSTLDVPADHFTRHAFVCAELIDENTYGTLRKIESIGELSGHAIRIETDSHVLMLLHPNEGTQVVQFGGAGDISLEDLEAFNADTSVDWLGEPKSLVLVSSGDLEPVIAPTLAEHDLYNIELASFTASEPD